MMRRFRVRPHQVVLGMGVVFAVFSIASGAGPAVVGWEDHSPVTRQIFGNVPDPLRVIFYTVIPILLLAGAWLFALRVKNWERGQPDRRPTTTGNVRRRLERLREGLSMKTL